MSTEHDIFHTIFQSDPIAADVYAYWLETGRPSTVRTISEGIVIASYNAG